MKVKLSEAELEDFQNLYEELVGDIVSYPDFQDIPEATNWFLSTANYNVPHGKKIRAVMTIIAVREFATEQDPKLVRKSHVLGWICEMLQAGGLVADDIIDQTETRRGRPYWHKVVGGAALNDAFILENVAYHILHKYFSMENYYMELVDLSRDMLLKTFMGQCLDINCSKGARENLKLFTMERYEKIVKYKTCYYSFVMPVFLAMTMAGFKDKNLKSQVEEILFLLGRYFQAQDDYLDCFGDEIVLGKKGTYIVEGKCTWVIKIIKALEKASPEQYSVLEKHYGQCTADSNEVNIIKNIFTELNVPVEYKVFEESMYQQISQLIQKLPTHLPQEFFFGILQFLFHRVR